MDVDVEQTCIHCRLSGPLKVHAANSNYRYLDCGQSKKYTGIKSVDNGCGLESIPRLTIILVECNIQQILFLTTLI